MDDAIWDDYQVSAYLYGIGGGIVLVLAGLLWWQGHRLDHVRTEFTAYKAAQTQAVADQVAQNERLRKATENLNAKIMVDLQAKLDGSVTNGVKLAIRLRSALAGVHTSSMPANPDQPGPAPASGGASGAAEIERLADEVRSSEAAAWAAGERDGIRLEKLIEELKP